VGLFPVALFYAKKNNKAGSKEENWNPDRLMPASSESANYAIMYRSYLDWRRWRVLEIVDGLSSRTCSTGETRYLPAGRQQRARSWISRLHSHQRRSQGNPSILTPGFVDCFVDEIQSQRDQSKSLSSYTPEAYTLIFQKFSPVHRYVVRCYLFLTYPRIFQWCLRASRLYDYISLQKRLY